MTEVHAMPVFVPSTSSPGQGDQSWKKPVTPFAEFLEPRLPQAQGGRIKVAECFPYAAGNPRYAAELPIGQVVPGNDGRDAEVVGNGEVYEALDPGNLTDGNMHPTLPGIGPCHDEKSPGRWPADVGEIDARNRIGWVPVCVDRLEGGKGDGCPTLGGAGDVVELVGKTLAHVALPGIGQSGSRSADDSGALRLRMPVGSERGEWILRPWRLQADGRLSYRGSVVLPYQVDAKDTTVMSTLASDRPGMSSTASVAYALFSTSWLDSPQFPLPAKAVLRNAETEGGDPFVASLSERGYMGAWNQWSQRMLRWKAGLTDGEDAVAWVRDYFLETNEIPGLVASLRAFSTGQGISLGRVMINGHEAWAATDHSRHGGGEGNGR